MSSGWSGRSKSAVSRWPYESSRWAHIAKTLNIRVYEMLTNRELTAESDWQRLRPWLHVPIDRIVLRHLKRINKRFTMRTVLKGMTKADCRRIQRAIQEKAAKREVPPIWFEAAWTAQNARPSHKMLL